VSFCGHAILGNHIFLIEDATQDPRFADNPLVIGEPHIRFYAGCPLRAVNGRKLGTLCIIDRRPRTLSEEDQEVLEDLAAMVEREFAAMELATVDELTNIANRRGFMTVAQSSLRLCQREDIPAALVYFDLDGFKQINDRFGHAEGDLALANFADQMATTFRDSDMIARLGGDEFVVLLTNSALEEANDVVARFTAALDAYNEQADNGYTIRFSHGVVAYDPQEHRTVADLLADGDSLMYRIKQAKM
jgi:diguanylate cyclase (GGDEF)-like protein